MSLSSGRMREFELRCEVEPGTFSSVADCMNFVRNGKSQAQVFHLASHPKVRLLYGLHPHPTRYLPVIKAIIYRYDSEAMYRNVSKVVAAIAKGQLQDSQTRKHLQKNEPKPLALEAGVSRLAALTEPMSEHLRQVCMREGPGFALSLRVPQDPLHPARIAMASLEDLLCKPEGLCPSAAPLAARRALVLADDDNADNTLAVLECSASRT